MKYFLEILFLKLFIIFQIVSNKKSKNDDIMKLNWNLLLDANEREKICETVLGNEISSILKGQGGQYDLPSV